MRRIKAEVLDTPHSSSLALVPQTSQQRNGQFNTPLALVPRSSNTSLVRSSKKSINQGRIREAVTNSMAYVQQRFLFNIEQIEQKYAKNSSGLVFNLKNDNVEFDPDECSAKNEKDLLNNVKKELHNHTLANYGGAALLSTPAEDPDEKDKTKINRWSKLNKLYDNFLKNAEKQKKNNQRLEVYKGPSTQLKRVPKFEPLADITNVTPRQQIHYPSNLFSQVIRQQDQVSNAGSHNIEEPVMPLLTKTFRTPRVKREVLMSEQRITRAQKRILEIEESYDQREAAIYVEGSDWVERWVQQTVTPQTPAMQSPSIQTPVFKTPAAKNPRNAPKSSRKNVTRRSNPDKTQNESSFGVKRAKFEKY